MLVALIRAARSAEKLQGEERLVRGRWRCGGGVHRAGQGVCSGGINQLAGLLELRVLVDVDRKDRAEDFLDHSDRFGIFGEDDSGLNKISLRVVTYIQT